MAFDFQVVNKAAGDERCAQDFEVKRDQRVFEVDREQTLKFPDWHTKWGDYLGRYRVSRLSGLQCRARQIHSAGQTWPRRKGWTDTWMERMAATAPTLAETERA
jgi:hypothetical protein